MFASFIAGEKSNPATVPLLLPTMPASDGAILFTPACVEWQTAQWLANTVWPAEGSPAASAADELASTAISTRPALPKHGPISSSRTSPVLLVVGGEQYAGISK
jgi:hypothetical protein